HHVNERRDIDLVHFVELVLAVIKTHAHDNPLGPLVSQTVPKGRGRADGGEHAGTAGSAARRSLRCARGITRSPFLDAFFIGAGRGLQLGRGRSEELGELALNFRQPARGPRVWSAPPASLFNTVNIRGTRSRTGRWRSPRIVLRERRKRAAQPRDAFPRVSCRLSPTFFALSTPE